MEQLYKDRLLKLAAHLETGELGHEVFDFALINDAQGPECGTRGCAIGELPIVFPDEWKFSSRGSVFMSSPLEERRVNESGVRTFFSLSDKEYLFLFTPFDGPHSYMPIWYKVTDTEAKKEEVAANIRRFVAWKEENNGQGS